MGDAHDIAKHEKITFITYVVSETDIYAALLSKLKNSFSFSSFLPIFLNIQNIPSFIWEKKRNKKKR